MTICDHRSIRLLSVFLLLSAPSLFAQELPAKGSENSEEETFIAIATPVEALIRGVPERLGSELAEADVEVRAGEEALRREHAFGWLMEALAPLKTEPCRRVFARAGITVSFPDVDALAKTMDARRPMAAAPNAEAIIVPQSLPVLDDSQQAIFSSTGLLPFEISLTGEWARASAAKRAGPPSADPLLRQARAARLEGIARLAGLVVSLRGAGIEPDVLGTGLLDAGREVAGWPGRALEATRDPLVRSAFRVFLDDGMRWAVYHYLRSGMTGVVAEIERPGQGPAEILTPGRRTAARRLPAEGCRLGPRGAAVLLIDDDDPPWIAGLQADLFQPDAAGKVHAWLAFVSEKAAGRAAIALEDRGYTLRLAGALLEVKK